MINTLHCCFVRVHRASGSFPPDDVEGEPWYVVRDRLLRVKETKPDDPEAELMVSFLLASKTLVNASAASDIELELRLQVCSGVVVGAGGGPGCFQPRRAWSL